MPRGCKPGQKHSGHFKKGFDERRHVTGPYHARRRTIEEVCKREAGKALKALLKVIEDDEAPHKDRVLAANTLLDRAYGKTVDRVQVASINTGGGDVGTLTRDELMARLTQQYTTPVLEHGVQDEFGDLGSDEPLDGDVDEDELGDELSYG